MKDSDSVHQKVQEMCDCYATTDLLKEMSVLNSKDDTTTAAIKWIALAALHGVNANAKKITISSEDGETVVIAKYRKTELPSPGSDVGEKILEAFKEISHIEEEKGETALALGIRDSSIDAHIKIDEKDKDNFKVTLSFK